MCYGYNVKCKRTELYFFIMYTICECRIPKEFFYNSSTIPNSHSQCHNVCFYRLFVRFVCMLCHFKMLGLYLFTRIIGHKSCKYVKYTNKINIAKRIAKSCDK